MMEEFASLSRRELQAQAKKHGIRANQKTDELVVQLRSKTEAEARAAASLATPVNVKNKNKKKTNNNANENDADNGLCEDVARMSLKDKHDLGGKKAGKTSRTRYESPLGMLMRRASGSASFLRTPGARIPGGRRSSTSSSSTSTIAELWAEKAKDKDRVSTPNPNQVKEEEEEDDDAEEENSGAGVGGGKGDGDGDGDDDADAGMEVEEEEAKAEATKVATKTSKAKMTSRLSFAFSPMTAKAPTEPAASTRAHRNTMCPSELSASLAARKRATEHALSSGASTSASTSASSDAWASSGVTGSARQDADHIVLERVRIAVNAVDALRDSHGGGCSFDEVCEFIKKNPTQYYDRGSTAVQLHRALRIAVDETRVVGVRGATGELRFSVADEFTRLNASSRSAVAPRLSLGGFRTDRTPADGAGGAGSSGSPQPRLSLGGYSNANSSSSSSSSSSRRVSMGAGVSSLAQTWSARSGLSSSVGGARAAAMRPTGAGAGAGAGTGAGTASAGKAAMVAQVRTAVKQERLRRNRFRQGLKQVVQGNLQAVRAVRDTVDFVDETLQPSLSCVSCSGKLVVGDCPKPKPKPEPEPKQRSARPLLAGATATPQTAPRKSRWLRLQRERATVPAGVKEEEGEDDEGEGDGDEDEDGDADARADDDGNGLQEGDEGEEEEEEALVGESNAPSQQNADEADESSVWQLRASRSKPGKFYFHNRETGETKWSLDPENE